MADSTVERELRRIASAVERLEERVVRLESRPGSETLGAIPRDSSSEDTGSSEPVEERAYSIYFTRLALVAFILLGALVLRVATQQGWWDAMLGTGLGLLYCAGLLFVPALTARRGFLALHGSVAQIFGVLLAPLIVVETYHGARTLDVVPSTLVLLGSGLGGALVGAMGTHRSLTVMALLGSVVGLAGLGASLDGIVLRASSAAVLGIAALVLARWKGWPFLRPTLLVPIGVLIAIAVLATARREGVEGVVSVGLLLCALGLWLAVAAHHAVRSARLGPEAVIWLPVASAWAAGLAVFHSGWIAGPIALGVAGIVFSYCLWSSLGRSSPSPALVGLTTAGVLVGISGSWWIDPSGIGLVLIALLAHTVASLLRDEWTAVLSQLTAMIAAATALLGAGLVGPVAAVTAWTWSLGAVAGGLLIVHFALAGRKPDAPPKAAPLLAPLSLVAGLAVLFAVLRGVSLQVLGAGGGYELCLSGLLAASAIPLLVLGRRLSRTSMSVVGWICLGLLSVKVVLSDLFALTGLHLLGSVLALGLAFVVASLVLGSRDAASRSAPQA